MEEKKNEHKHHESKFEIQIDRMPGAFQSRVITS